jgi:hypothetical protein
LRPASAGTRAVEQKRACSLNDFGALIPTAAQPLGDRQQVRKVNLTKSRQTTADARLFL